MALRHGEMVVTGGAGSGKTHVCSTVARIHHGRELKVILAAPTGKAARRLAQASGLPATTLHRLLGYDGHAYNAPAPLDADLIIVDETSMVDAELAWELRRRIDPGRTCVLWVGDANQLAPVGPGSLLRDLVDGGHLPVARLTRIVRQAGILRENCNALLHGEVRPKARAAGGVQPWWVIDEYEDAAEIEQVVDRLYEGILAERLGFDLVDDVQLLTPAHKGPLGTAALNRRLQGIIQAKLYGAAVPEVGAGELAPLLANDRVIQGRNNYDTGIMNGEIGRVVAVEGPDAVVRFDTGPVRYGPDLRVGDGVRLAYALTIHRSQGSEFPCSIVLAHRSHAFMLNRSLLYVGVTRARTTAILVGGRRTLASAAARVDATRRRTFLSILEG
jgi:exodeoxyribonuclease V alpha subunit